MKGELNLLKQLSFVWGKNHSVDNCQVSSRLPAIALPYPQSISVFPWESLQKILCIIKCHSGRSRAHLAVSTEQVFVPKQQGLFVQIDFTFYNGPLWQPV